MKKHFLFLALIAFSAITVAQSVIIGGRDGNRPLTWNDFAGKPDKRSAFDANTHWNINYLFSGSSFSGDTVKLKGMSVKLELNPALSWVKPGKATDELLLHEQGHFNIGLLCQHEMIVQLGQTVLLKQNYQVKIQNIFNDVLHKYQQLALKYDEETDHSKNKERQQSWNDFLAKELN